MAHAARAEPNAARRYTKERYFRLVVEGVLQPDDRVELLEGVVVAMAPQNPRHAVAGDLVADALRRAVGERGAVRVQRSFVAGRYSVPEPAVAVVPGRLRDYGRSRPTAALLVVEVADSSLAQDRITKAAIYAAAGIPEYWIVNLRNDHVEVFRGASCGSAGTVSDSRSVPCGGRALRSTSCSPSASRSAPRAEAPARAAGSPCRPSPSSPVRRGSRRPGPCRRGTPRPVRDGGRSRRRRRARSRPGRSPARAPRPGRAPRDRGPCRAAAGSGSWRCSD